MFAMKEANTTTNDDAGSIAIPPAYVLRSQVSLLETMFLTFTVYLKQINLLDKQEAAIVEYLQQELTPLLQQAQTKDREVLEQVSMVAASNHVLYDSYLVHCKQQEAEIRMLRALLSVNNTNCGQDCDDDATLDMSESENYDELLHGEITASMNSSSASSKLLHSSFKSFTDSWTSFVQDERVSSKTQLVSTSLASTKGRVSESLSSTKDRVSGSIVNFAVERLGKSIPGC
jgi:hypothetical protein